MRLLAAGLVFASIVSAADAGLAGIWMGETTGRNGEKQDLAFQFQTAKGSITGVMFGDEFDLPVQDLRIDGDHVTFSVMSVDYYGAKKVKTIFAGTLTDKTLELVREQANPEPAAATGKPKEARQTIVLRRLS